MAKTLAEMLARLPPERQARIDTAYRELREEVESLRKLRKLADRSQVAMAKSLGVKQPSVAKIERQTDMYLSTLRNYVEAAGGSLDLVVRFPDRPPVRLTGLADLTRPEKASRRRQRQLEPV